MGNYKNRITFYSYFSSRYYFTIFNTFFYHVLLQTFQHALRWVYHCYTLHPLCSLVPETTRRGLSSSRVLFHSELDLIVFHNSFYFRPFCSCSSYQLAARCHFIHLKLVLLDTRTHLSYPDQCPVPGIRSDILDGLPLGLNFRRG